MFELRELDRELALGAASALREDVENQRAAVNDAAGQRFFKIAFLRAGQRMIEDHELCSMLGAGRADFFNLTFARVKRRIGPVAFASDDGCRVDTRRCGERLQFF